jgi:hypothetical protein
MQAKVNALRENDPLRFDKLSTAPILLPDPTLQSSWGRRADLGEGELRFWMKPEIINFETLTVIVAES